MKWTVKLVAQVVEGKRIKHEIAAIERADGISHPTTLDALRFTSRGKYRFQTKIPPAT